MRTIKRAVMLANQNIPSNAMAAQASSRYGGRSENDETTREVSVVWGINKPVNATESSLWKTVCNNCITIKSHLPFRLKASSHIAPSPCQSATPRHGFPSQLLHTIWHGSLYARGVDFPATDKIITSHDAIWENVDTDARGKRWHRIPTSWARTLLSAMPSQLRF